MSGTDAAKSGDQTQAAASQTIIGHLHWRSPAFVGGMEANGHKYRMSASHPGNLAWLASLMHFIQAATNLRTCAQDATFHRTERASFVAGFVRHGSRETRG